VHCDECSLQLIVFEKETLLSFHNNRVLLHNSHLAQSNGVAGSETLALIELSGLGSKFFVFQYRQNAVAGLIKNVFWACYIKYAANQQICYSCKFGPL
jgi:hypothetical protein